MRLVLAAAVVTASTPAFADARDNSRRWQAGQYGWFCPVHSYSPMDPFQWIACVALGGSQHDFS